jgi:hypothetical protein
MIILTAGRVSLERTDIVQSSSEEINTMITRNSDKCSKRNQPKWSPVPKIVNKHNDLKCLYNPYGQQKPQSDTLPGFIL